MTQAVPAARKPRRRSSVASWLFWLLLGLAALLLWLWPTGLRRTQQVFVLSDGTRYEVEYFARWVGWEPPPPEDFGQELLDPKVIFDVPRYDFSIRRRGWLGVCTHNLRMVWEDVIGWWDVCRDWFGAVKDWFGNDTRNLDNDLYFELIGLDIKRDGVRLELSEGDRQRLYLGMAKRLHTRKAEIWQGSDADFRFTELVHCDESPDGEWLIIAGYFLRCDGRWLWIEAGTLRP